jgi:hypothetical protein
MLRMTRNTRIAPNGVTALLWRPVFFFGEPLLGLAEMRHTNLSIRMAKTIREISMPVQYPLSSASSA